MRIAKFKKFLPTPKNGANYELSQPVKFYHNNELCESLFVGVVALEDNGRSKIKKIFTHAYPTNSAGSFLSWKPLAEIKGEDHKGCLKLLGYQMGEK